MFWALEEQAQFCMLAFLPQKNCTEHQAILPSKKVEILTCHPKQDDIVKKPYLTTLAGQPQVNMELDLQSLFGLHEHSCAHWLRPRNLPHPPAFGLRSEGGGATYSRPCTRPVVTFIIQNSLGSYTMTGTKNVFTTVSSRLSNSAQVDKVQTQKLALG